MRIVYNNLIDALESTAITPSSEYSTYYIENVQDQRLTTRWISDDATTQTVIFDLGATTSTTVYAIAGHLLNSGCTVTVKGNDDIATSGGALVWVASGESSTQSITYNAGIMLTFVNAISNRYWKFTFSGLTVPAEIGRLWIGNYVTLSPSSLDNFTVTKKRSDTVLYGRNRQKYASPGIGWREFDLSFPKSSSTMCTAIQTLYDSVGNHSSVIFCNFDTLRGYEIVEPCYCSIDGEISFTHQGKQAYNYSLKLSEDK
jgi:hypothetical protein